MPCCVAGRESPAAGSVYLLHDNLKPVFRQICFYNAFLGEVLPTYLSSLDLHEKVGSVYLVHDTLTCSFRHTELFLGQEQCFLFNCHHVTCRVYSTFTRCTTYINKVYKVQMKDIEMFF